MLVVKGDDELNALAFGHLNQSVNDDPSNFQDLTLLATYRFFEGWLEEATCLLKAALTITP